jgi:hypothetical protein
VFAAHQPVVAFGAQRAILSSTNDVRRVVDVFHDVEAT